MPTDLDQLLTMLEKLNSIVDRLATLVESNGKAIIDADLKAEGHRLKINALDDRLRELEQRGR